jgi:hypothetical protein
LKQQQKKKKKKKKAPTFEVSIFDGNHPPWFSPILIIGVL